MAIGTTRSTRLHGVVAVSQLFPDKPLAWELNSSNDTAMLLLASGHYPARARTKDVRALAGAIRDAELARRRSFSTPLDLSADAYVVRRDTAAR